MTAIDLDETTPAGPRKRPLVWPWAILSAGLFAFLLPMALALVGVPDRFYLAMTIASAPLGFAVAFSLSRRPALRVGLLAGSVLMAVAWATSVYLEYLHVWGWRDRRPHLLPWGVSSLPAWAVAAQPVVLTGSLVLAIVAMVRLQRSLLHRSGWWTAALVAALVLSFLAGVHTLVVRVYAR